MDHEDMKKRAESDSQPKKSSKPKKKAQTPNAFDALLENMRIPGLIEVGPVTTVGAVLAARKGDPPPPGRRDVLTTPTPKELFDLCRQRMGELDPSEAEQGSMPGKEGQGEAKPTFGPEQAPKK